MSGSLAGGYVYSVPTRYFVVDPRVVLYGHGWHFVAIRYENTIAQLPLACRSQWFISVHVIPSLNVGDQGYVSHLRTLRSTLLCGPHLRPNRESSSLLLFIGTSVNWYWNSIYTALNENSNDNPVEIFTPGSSGTRNSKRKNVCISGVFIWI